jgi:transcriptional regulator with XRE-family HTH domain
MGIRTVMAGNLRRIRKAKGLSQEELAFECGVHRTYVSGVERAIRNPTITIVAKIADALDVPASALLEAPAGD